MRAEDDGELGFRDVVGGVGPDRHRLAVGHHAPGRGLVEQFRAPRVVDLLVHRLLAALLDPGVPGAEIGDARRPHLGSAVHRRQPG